MPRAKAILGSLLALTMLGSAIGAGGAVPEDDPVVVVVGFHTMPLGLKAGDTYLGGTIGKVNPVLRYATVVTSMPGLALGAPSWDPNLRYSHEQVIQYASYVPNDPRYDEMYGPQHVNAEEAWDTTLGENTKNVCIIDTGVRYTHEDLTGDRWLGGYDYVNDDDDPVDDHGHGTHTTGTAAASTDNGKGVAGIAQVGIKHVKALNANGAGNAQDIADAIQWCADNEGHVISMSLGGGAAQEEEDAVNYAWDAGMVIVAAAGNDGPCNDCVGYPAAYDNVQAITCTNDADGQCGFSSDGPESDLAAPGDDVLSTYNGGNDDYAELSGTSMSTPHVAGVAALVWSLAPTLSNAELIDILHESAKDLGDAGWDEEFGHGLVDAGEAVALAPGGGPPGNNRPNAHAGFDHTFFDEDESGSAMVTLDGTRSTDPDGSVAQWEWIEDDVVIATGVNPSLSMGLGSHRIRLKVTDNVGGEDFDTVIIKVMMPDGGPDYDQQFEAGAGGWTSQSAGGATVWGLTTARSTSPTHSFGFTNYGDNEDDKLLSPDIDLRSADGATLTVQSWMEGEENCFLGCFPLDSGRIEASKDGGTSWTILKDDYTMSGGNFEELTFDLDDYVGDFAQLRFTFFSDGNGAGGEGWYLDDIHVVTDAPPQQAPIATTVPDVKVVDADQDGSEAVTLDANDAHDPDGTIAAYEWKDPDGNVIATTKTTTVTLGTGRHSFTLKVTDNDGLTGSDTVDAKVTDPTGGPDFLDDFEAGLGAWVAQSGGGAADWAITDARSSSPSNSVALRNYGAGEDDTLTSPSIDLVSADSVTLKVKSWMAGEQSCLLGCFINDYGTIEVSKDGGTTWRTLKDDYYTSGGDFEALEFNLDQEAGNAIKLRFSFASDGQNEFEGWYLDDVNVITGAEATPGQDPPVADAGPDQTVVDVDNNGVQAATLDGSDSTDSDGLVVGYAWSEGGTPIATGAQPTVTLSVGTHTLTLEVTDDDGAIDTDTVVVSVMGLAFSDGFEGSVAGWTIQNNGGTAGAWALSTARANSPTHSFAIANYGLLEDDNLVSPAIDLAGKTKATLRLASWVEGYEPCYIVGCSAFDYGTIEVTEDGGQTWRQLLTDHLDTNDVFRALEFNLDQEAGSTIQVRFHWTSFVWGGFGEGWYIDDFELLAG